MSDYYDDYNGRDHSSRYDLGRSIRWESPADQYYGHRESERQYGSAARSRQKGNKFMAMLKFIQSFFTKDQEKIEALIKESVEWETGKRKK